MIIQVIGVSGCGKTTIARKLSESMGLPYYDADDFHPQANIDKMSNGQPLNDEDRASWLATLSMNLQQWEQEGGAILACSALKEKYRKVLARGLDHCHWVFLSGSYELILERMNKRKDHYMSGEMLKSQFEALEVPAYGIHIDIQKSPEEIIEKIKSSL
ncbi:gluconokinase [Lutimonas sp.]|uniref:gluconokinase n=1 Tax=Lutimonas sp. TaxID=1872403 RepID=UPI003C7697AA